MRRGKREAHFQSVSKLPVKLASSGGAVAAVLRDALSGTHPRTRVRENGTLLRGVAVTLSALAVSSPSGRLATEYLY